MLADRLAAALALLVLLGGCASPVDGRSSSTDQDRAQARFLPSEDNQDPSEDIDDVERIEYEPLHAAPGQRVAYDQSPPFGGAHDQVWADCTGIVYAEAVRTEHMVHSLEHGAVWIAYEPEKVPAADVDSLAAKVDGQPYLMMSPYPGMDQPISLQSWGHRLKLERAGDERFDQFIRALRSNPYTSPEPHAPCGTADPTVFDVTNPPPFEPSPPGPGAMPVDGS